MLVLGTQAVPPTLYLVLDLHSKSHADRLLQRRNFVIGIYILDR